MLQCTVAAARCYSASTLHWPLDVTVTVPQVEFSIRAASEAFVEADELSVPRIHLEKSPCCARFFKDSVVPPCCVQQVAKLQATRAVR